MSNIVSLTEYKKSHSPAYLLGVYLDAWKKWSSTKPTHNAGKWDKERNDAAVQKERKANNSRVKASLKRGGQ